MLDNQGQKCKRGAGTQYILFISFAWQKGSESTLSLQIITVSTLLMDTFVKLTPRVGPCLYLLPLLDSVQDRHLGKMATCCLSQRCLF